MLTLDPEQRPSATQLQRCKLFSNHDFGQIIQSVRRACPPTSQLLDNVHVNSESSSRISACKELKLISQKCLSDVVSFGMLFHTLEIFERLPENFSYMTINEILLVSMYIIHKYLSEDQVKDPLSFSSFYENLIGAGWLPETGTIRRKTEAEWRSNEFYILQELGWITYRKTPYEHSGSSENLERLLMAYISCPSGNYHVGDIVAAARFLPVT
jgi:hypothetical protein